MCGITLRLWAVNLKDLIVEVEEEDGGDGEYGQEEGSADVLRSKNDFTFRTALQSRQGRVSSCLRGTMVGAEDGGEGVGEEGWEEY